MIAFETLKPLIYSNIARSIRGRRIGVATGRPVIASGCSSPETIHAGRQDVGGVALRHGHVHEISGMLRGDAQAYCLARSESKGSC